MNFFKILLQSIKARLTPLITKFKLYTKPSFIFARISEILKTFFTQTLNIKPRHKDDYYTIGRWMVSKKLAFAVVIIVGVLSVAFIYSSWSGLFPGSKNDGIKTYDYNDVLLKFTKGTVRIRGKSGYLAYEGDVSSGACNGQGTLMNPAGFVVYQGSFSNNMYEGTGNQYYQDGTLWYQGLFHENLHSGTGRLFRTNGSLEYEGEFALDMKEGQGTLYDFGHNPIFTGQFTLDDIKYSDLIGKKAGEIVSAYSGKRTLYQAEGERTRFMPDISAMTVEYLDEESIDTEATVEQVYVMKDSFNTAEGPVKTFNSLAPYLGQPIYVGVSYATLPEILTVNKLNAASEGIVMGGPADIDMTSVFTEYTEVGSYDEEYEVYLHTYHKDGLLYTFVTEQGLDTFSFYYIKAENLSDVK
ncbi:MAG: hypothetical protein J6X66_09790 [Lachnospiraceae bacterium]|nr:hypothetical protein [Lachnospiraceae bacterium]